MSSESEARRGYCTSSSRRVSRPTWELRLKLNDDYVGFREPTNARQAGVVPRPPGLLGRPQVRSCTQPRRASSELSWFVPGHGLRQFRSDHCERYTEGAFPERSSMGPAIDEEVIGRTWTRPLRHPSASRARGGAHLSSTCSCSPQAGRGRRRRPSPDLKVWLRKSETGHREGSRDLHEVGLITMLSKEQVHPG